MLHTRSGSDTDFCPMIKPHILVAEIDIVLMNGLARALRENGYQASKASGVVDLQSIIETIGVDLILMDCLLLAVWEWARRADLMCAGTQVRRTILSVETSSLPDMARRIARQRRNLQLPDRGYLETRDQFPEAFLIFGVRRSFEQ